MLYAPPIGQASVPEIDPVYRFNPAVTLALAVHGNLRTMTMRGFGEKEMENLLGSLA